MARYGNDFSRSGYTGRQRMGGYDAGFGQAGEFSSGRGHGWRDYEGWGTRNNRGGGRGLNETWGSMGPGGGRPDYGDEGRGTRGSMGGRSYRTGSSWGTTSRNRDVGYGGYGMSRNVYDREMRSFGGRAGYDYDEDFGDRLRRGWTRLREEARGRMGRR